MSVLARDGADAGAQVTKREAQARVVMLSVPQLHCAGCIGKVERALRAEPGIEEARVNLTLKRVTAQTDLAAAALVEVLARAGFEAHPLDMGIVGKDSDPVGRDLAVRMGVAGFAMMNVMLLSVAVWSGAGGVTREMFHLISAAIALPVVGYSAQPFFRSAWSALRGRGLNMDVPISLAIALAAGMSVYEALYGGRHVYFDAALSLTFFLLIGRYLDHRTRAAARSAARELAALESQVAQRMEDGQAVEVALNALRVGDEVLVPTGTRVPVDGRLLSVQAVTDRSFLTGESRAVTSAREAQMRAGEINLGAPFVLCSTAVGEDSSLRRVARLVEAAEAARNSYTGLADRAAQIYAPVVHLLALAAFVGWVSATGDVRHAVNVAIAVLIITCPCALGLAVPAVSTAAIGRLFSMGVLVKSGTALERLASVHHVVFDKTGTLTLPEIGSGLGRLDGAARGVAVALAQQSHHPVARAVAAQLAGTQPAEIDAVEDLAGLGVQARWNGQRVQLGRADWVGGTGVGLSLRVGDAVFALDQDERLRPGAGAAVAGLARQGMTVSLLSGDRAGPVRAVARDLGITEAEAGLSGEEKHARILAHPGPVAMVGDGLNDTAALAAAAASIAPSSALDASRNAADVLLLREGLDALPAVFEIARRARAISMQNFAIAAAYNLIAVPIALAGFATPLIAALAMSASSLTVLLNAVRVGRIRQRPAVVARADLGRVAAGQVMEGQAG